MRKNSLTMIGTGLLLAAAGAYALVEKPTLTDFLTPDVEPNTATTAELVTNASLLQAEALSGEISAEDALEHEVASKVAINSIADLAGDYVQSYSTLISSGFPGGCSVTFKPVAGTDSIIIENFWTTNTPPLTVKGKVNISAKTIEIPNQNLYVHDTYGQMDVAVITDAGKPNRTAKITGRILDDGSVILDSWWAVFVVAGSYKDQYVTANYNTLYERANATISSKLLSGNQTLSQTYKVRVELPASNVLLVKNFYNAGLSAEMTLNDDRSATIPSQVVMKNSYGDWKTIGDLVFNDAGNLSQYSTIITTNKAAANDNKTITWGNWSVLTTGYYGGNITSTTLTMENEVKYPTNTVTSLEGEGTQANPWKIKTLEDLVWISNQVNSNTDLSWSITPTSQKYARVFLGKYFELANDIDMSGYRFTPIGQDWTHHFAGSLDGKNHKIQNLTIQSGLYNGLFGRTDTTTVIKNIVFENPNIRTTDANYTGVAAAWSLGLIENVTVNNPYLYSVGQGTGGIAGVGQNVKNCTVNNPEIMALNGFSGGVVGQLNGSMENCSAVNINMVCASPTTGSPFGGVVGTAYGPTVVVDGCYATGILNGNNTAMGGYPSQVNIGGVVGNLYYGTLKNSFFAGTIRGYGGESMQGGVAGSSYGAIENCHANAHIYGYSSRYSGGVIGYVRYVETAGRPAPTVKNCYSVTPLEAETYMYEPETETREIFGKVQDLNNFSAENCYFDNQMVNFGSKNNYGLTTAELTSAAGPKGFSSSTWTFREGYYPVLTKFKDTEAANFAASGLMLGAGSSVYRVDVNAKLATLGNTDFKLLNNGKLDNESANLRINGNTLSLKGTFGTDTLFMRNGTASVYYVLKVSPKFFDGEGTEDNPYQIKTKADLIKLSEVTTKVKQLYPETYFKMMNDIDLEYDDAFLGICGDADDAHNQFEGVFDGGGYTIHKMKIARVVWTVKPTATTMGTPKTGTGGSTGYSGFIGRLEAKGVLRNLNIAADCDLSETWATSGALVGTNNGLVENCRNYADVTGFSCWIGGIVGQGSVGSIIRNCYNAGTITSGYMDVGGIAGQTHGYVENCANAGDIRLISISTFQASTKTTFNRAGGIAAGSYGGEFKNCLNVGNIISWTAYAGGIIGNFPVKSSTTYDYDNNMISCVNYGQVQNGPNGSKQYIGAIAGGAGSKGTIKGNYYDKQITLWGAWENSASSGMTGLNTAEMTNGKALADMDADAWVFEAGKYPVLKLFKDEPKIIAASQVQVKFPTDVTVADANQDASLATGMTWSLAKGKDFKIDGNTLKVPTSVKELTLDTLKVTFNGFNKAIALQAQPACPLKGQGTEKDPYLISSIDDWRNIVNWMNALNNGLEGKFLKVTADISFASMDDYQPMANNGSTFFKGTLDGDGHKFTRIFWDQKNTYEGGVFGVIDRSGVVKNLTVSGAVAGTKTYCGGIVGKLYGTLENVTSEVVTVSTVGSVGGIAGMIYSSASLTKVINKGNVKGNGANIGGIAPQIEVGVTFTDCGNEGDITQTSTTTAKYTGGLIGTCYPATFIRCYNNGTVKATETGANTKPTIIAGLVAYCNASANSQDYIFEECYNEGEISGNGLIGGLTGDVNATAGNTRFKMTKCYNTGKVASLSTVAISSNPTAGLCVFYPAGSEFIDCYNTGEISSKMNVYVGGIAGYYKPTGTAAYPVKFNGCWNTGAIIADGNQGGGICGATNSYTTIENCWNEGKITGGFILGGITGGQLGTNNNIINCWNSGDVETKTNRAGGISAQCTSTSAIIQGCINFGNISSTSEIKGTTTTSGYGVAGISANCYATVIDCYNMGDLKGACNVGGIVGQISKNNTKLENCYTIGKITCDADTCGNIVGENTDNGRKWSDQNYVKNCFYLDEVAVEKPNNKQGEAISMAELLKKNMGENWSSYDEYCMPVVTFHKNLDAAKVKSIHYALSEGETTEKVTKSFKVGAPEGVEWTSSLPGVVVNGNDVTFTQTAKGDLTLTAKAGDYSKEFKFNVDVFVEVMPTSIELDKTELTLLEGETAKINATVLPENTTDPTLTWSSDNAAVATVANDGTVTAVAVGEATITVSCGDVKATCKVTVNKMDGIYGIYVDADTRFNIYTVSGMVIGTDKTIEDIKNLSNGTYIIVSGNKTWKIKI